MSVAWRSPTVFASLVCFATAAVSANGLKITKFLPMELAIEAAQSALDSCAARGYPVSVSVVTRQGATKLVIAADGSSPIATETSRRKAYTAATIGISTAEFADYVKTLPGGSLSIDSNIFAMAGGLPIVVNGEVIAGIGVGGAPQSTADEACARVGIAKIADRLR